MSDAEIIHVSLWVSMILIPILAAIAVYLKQTWTIKDRYIFPILALTAVPSTMADLYIVHARMGLTPEMWEWIQTVGIGILAALTASGIYVGANAIIEKRKE